MKQAKMSLLSAILIHRQHKTTGRDNGETYEIVKIEGDSTSNERETVLLTAYRQDEFGYVCTLRHLIHADNILNNRTESSCLQSHTVIANCVSSRQYISSQIKKNLIPSTRNKSVTVENSMYFSDSDSNSGYDDIPDLNFDSDSEYSDTDMPELISNDTDDDDYDIPVVRCIARKVNNSISATVNMMKVTEMESDVHYNPVQRRSANSVYDAHSTVGGHMNDATFGKMLDAGTWANFPYNSEDLRVARKLYGVCPACIQGKAEADPASETTRPPSTRPGQRLNADLIQYDTITIGGNKVCLIVSDDFTDWTTDIPMPSKREQDLILAIDSVISFFNKYGHKVEELATDHENCLGTLKTYLGKYQIKLS